MHPVLRRRQICSRSLDERHQRWWSSVVRGYEYTSTVQTHATAQAHARRRQENRHNERYFDTLYTQIGLRLAIALYLAESMTC